MATNTLDPHLMGIVDTLDMARDNVPAKLHCTARGCPKFLVNAYKGICCDGSICESCFQTSTNACPVCESSPYSLESERCKPNSAARKFAKEWLKKVAKTKAAEFEQTKSPRKESTLAGRLESVEASAVNGAPVASTLASDPAVPPPVDDVGLPAAGNGAVLQSVEDPEDNADPLSDPADADAGDDEVEIQVEPSQEDQEYMDNHVKGMEEQEEQFAKESQHVSEGPSRPSSREKQHTPPKSSNFDTASNIGFGNVDFNQMMQMMQNNPMGFNPMMGMPMAMNPMANMFGGFGGPNAGMNGINGMNMGMSMNFNPNMFGNLQNNMWQNSNQNAFSGMGNDFNYGFNSNQQQNYPNGDFQSGHGRGYGRGRGRGRAGFGRGRGNLQYQNQNPNRSNHFQNAHEQQQYDIQNMQAQMNNGQRASRPEPIVQPKEEEPQADDDEFAPGGQDDVQEALGEDYVKKEIVPAERTEVEKPVVAANEAAVPEAESEQDDVVVTEQNAIEEQPARTTPYVQSPEVESREAERKPIAEAYEEDLDMAMPPPTAPSGPSGRYGEKDYGFRARGHGRHPRSRGSFHLTNGPPPSPVRSSSSITLPRPDSAGTGVVGAPTGPKAMREPPTRPSRQSSTSGGFQIMGRASLGPSRVSERERSLTPNGYDNQKSADRLPTRQSSRRDDRDNGRLEDERENYNQERRHHKSKRGPSGDYDMQDADNSYSRSSSHDRNKPHRSRRDKDNDKNGTDARHSSRRYRDEAADGDYDMNDYGEPIAESDKPRSHRKHRDEKYPKDRDRERERERDRDRERDKPRDKDRKRSRNDRDHEDESDHDRRHRSSKHHKKEHTKELEINGRASRRESQVPTPVATPTSTFKEADKDPYTLEREARQRERMLKEDQRREKAANAKATGGSGTGRRVSYKTEEDAQRGMEERESAMRAQRWR